MNKKWITIAGLVGTLYLLEKNTRQRKHPREQVYSPSNSERPATTPSDNSHWLPMALAHSRMMAMITTMGIRQ